LTQYDGSIGPTACLLTICGAIKGALEQIKLGKIPSLTGRMGLQHPSYRILNSGV
jgi:hypothetical protein